MAKVRGYCEERFQRLRELLQVNIDSGEELGASLAVQIDGKLVVDLWGGYRDQEKTKPWEEDTVVNVWSTSKAVSSVAAMILVDRGLLDLDENVCKYWPEFAANGKDQIKVRRVISHTSGVPAWEQPVELEDIYDVEKSNTRLAQQPPWWTPGTTWGYHIFTHGHLISELTRRVTGKSLKQFIAEEMAKPLGADFQLGLLPQDYSRVATVIPPTPVAFSPPPAGSITEKTLKGSPIDTELVNTKGWRDAEIGGGNGHGNGRSIAKILSPIVLGTVNDIEYVSAKTVDRIFQVQASGKDLVAGMNMRIGSGFGLPTPGTFWDWAPAHKVCGWGGWGRSMGIMDVGRRMTIGYALNKMHDGGLGSACSKAHGAEIYRTVGVE